MGNKIYYIIILIKNQEINMSKEITKNEVTIYIYYGI